jgi:hypothetical protein
MTDKEAHDKEHDSMKDPKPYCEFCRYEVYRRTHRCYGDGSSSIPTPISIIKEEK